MKRRPWIDYFKEQMRKGIETTFSIIHYKGKNTQKDIHAVSAEGFLMKIALILGYTFEKLLP